MMKIILNLKLSSYKILKNNKRTNCAIGVGTKYYNIIKTQFKFICDLKENLIKDLEISQKLYKNFDRV